MLRKNPKKKKMMTRQTQTNRSESQKDNFDYIEEIKRLKDLLDCGAITQEEYDTKKAKLLQ